MRISPTGTQNLTALTGGSTELAQRGTRRDTVGRPAEDADLVSTRSNHALREVIARNKAAESALAAVAIADAGIARIGDALKGGLEALNGGTSDALVIVNVTQQIDSVVAETRFGGQSLLNGRAAIAASAGDTQYGIGDFRSASLGLVPDAPASESLTQAARTVGEARIALANLADGLSGGHAARRVTLAEFGGLTEADRAMSLVKGAAGAALASHASLDASRVQSLLA
jgi:hypothetical protein